MLVTASLEYFRAVAKFALKEHMEILISTAYSYKDPGSTSHEHPSQMGFYQVQGSQHLS